MLLTPNWREWYHVRHQQACFASGTPFEDYVTRLLRRFHDDFTNPSPAGTLGDGGCDGLAGSGQVLYACYGQRPARNAERVSVDRALITVGSELLETLQTPKSVSALWEQYGRRERGAGAAHHVTFDWFSLALASLFAINLVEWTPSGHLRRADVR